MDFSVVIGESQLKVHETNYLLYRYKKGTFSCIKLCKLKTQIIYEGPMDL